MSGKTDHVGVTTMETIYQCHLHPLQEQPETDMSQPGIKPWPERWEASTTSNSLLIAIQNIYCTWASESNSASTMKKNHAHKPFLEIDSCLTEQDPLHPGLAKIDPERPWMP